MSSAFPGWLQSGVRLAVHEVEERGMDVVLVGGIVGVSVSLAVAGARAILGSVLFLIQRPASMSRAATGDRPSSVPIAA
jgi:hypothetical protein